MTYQANPTPQPISTTRTGVVDVPFRLSSSARSNPHPVSGGLCLRKGLVHQTDDAQIVCQHQTTETQTEILSRWSDGSIRWLLVSWAKPAAFDSDQCTLRLGANDPSLMSHGVNPESNTPPQVLLRRTGHRFSLQQSDPTVDPLQYTEFDLTPVITAPDGRSLDFKFQDIRTEVEGAIRAVYEVDGHLASDPRITLQLQFEIWPTIGMVRLNSRIRNVRRARHKGGLWDLGDAGSFRFSGLQLNFTLQTCDAMKIRWKTQDDADVRHQSADSVLRITQFGSGGPAWGNANHVSADGESHVTKRGYEATSDTGTVRGYRATPVVAVEANDCRLGLAIPEFWQKFPSSIQVNNGVVSADLFPRSVAGEHELQGGEQSTQAVWLCTRPMDSQLNDLSCMSEQPTMLQSADWVQQARVFDWFAGDIAAVSDRSVTQRYESWRTDVSTGDRSVEARREIIDEYGWRNFGDVHADHEQTHYAEQNTIVSHYNNQFDMIYGAIVNGIAAGDPSWRQLSDPLARHVMDIDIYRTKEDRAGFNGGLFWHTDHYLDARSATHRTYSRHNTPEGGDYGGGPSNEHNYSTGLLSYYYLTGNKEAAESVLSLADWVIGMDDGSATIFSLLDDGPTGAASATVTDDYHGPGRGSGNSINVLLDGWEVSKAPKYLAKAEELIRRVTHPQQDLEALNLLDAEYRWSYTVCLTSMGRYLHKMEEAGQLGPMYDYVRRTLSHYGTWMLANERPTLSEPDNLEFITEAWAAQEFRKANVLRIAASCCDEDNLATQMRIKADELNDAAWKDLYAFGDKHLTARCFSIVMTEGLRDIFHRTQRDHHTAQPVESCPPSDWTMFVSQRSRIKQLLKSPKQLLPAMTRLLSPQRWNRAADAFRRRM